MKGIMFSLVTMVLAGTILSVIIFYSISISRHREIIGTEVRVREMYSLYKSILRDWDKEVKMIAFPRAISSAISYVITNGIGLDEADKRLEELVINGSLFGKKEVLLEGTTIPEWIEKIKLLSMERGFIVEISLLSYGVKPFDSWNLLFEANLSINITEKDGIASLNKIVEKSNLISIIGFEDPIYPLNTLGRATNIITKSPYSANFTSLLASGAHGNYSFYGPTLITSRDYVGSINENKSIILVIDDVSGVKSLIEQKFGGVICECEENFSIPFVSGVNNATKILPNNTKLLINERKVWYIENLKDHLRNSFYITSNKGGSFLDRLEGKLEVQEKYRSKSENVIGLESLVNKVYLKSLDLPISGEKSNVDHLYFSEVSHTAKPVKGFYLEGFGYELRMDSELCGDLSHAEIYQVNEILEET